MQHKGRKPNPVTKTLQPTLISLNHEFSIFLDASFSSSNLHAGMGAICKNLACHWVEGIRGNIINNDSTLAKILAIYKTLMWIKAKQLTNYIILPDSLVVVDCINGNTRIRDKFSNYTI